MRRLVWAFADRTYHIVGNLMPWLKCIFNIQSSKPTPYLGQIFVISWFTGHFFLSDLGFGEGDEKKSFENDQLYLVPIFHKIFKIGGTGGGIHLNPLWIGHWNLSYHTVYIFY